MTSLAQKAFVDRLPDKVEIKNAEQIKTIIASQSKEGESTTLQLAINDGNGKNVTLTPTLTPTLAASLLALLEVISSGRGFQMIPVDSNLTTQQAADLLDVPRSFLINLLEKGDIRFIKRGRHRYVQANDLFAYKKNMMQNAPRPWMISYALMQSGLMPKKITYESLHCPIS